MAHYVTWTFPKKVLRRLLPTRGSGGYLRLCVSVAPLPVQPA